MITMLFVANAATNFVLSAKREVTKVRVRRSVDDGSMDHDSINDAGYESFDMTLKAVLDRPANPSKEIVWSQMKKWKKRRKSI